MHKFTLKNLIFYFCIIATTLIFFIPYFRSGIVGSSDQPYHLTRINTLAYAIKNGVFPVKVHSMQCYGYGYGTGFFYSDALIYFPASLIAFFKLSLETSYKMFALIIILCTLLSFIYSSYLLCHNKYIALGLGIIFLFNPILFSAYYIHMGVGTFTGAIFMPLAISGMIKFLATDKPRQCPFLLIIGFIGLFYTHTLSAVMTFIVCFLLFILNLKNISLNKIIYLAMSAFIVLAISCSYWLPMLEQMREQILKYTRPWTWEELQVKPLAYLLDNSSGIGIIIFLLLIFAVIASALLIHKGNITKICIEGVQLLSISLLFFILPSIYIFWHIFNFKFKIFQFPERLYLPGIVCLLLAISILISQLNDNSRSNALLPPLSYRLITITLYVLAVCSIFLAYTSHEISDCNYVEIAEINGFSGVGAGEEWLPVETNVEDLTTPETAYADDGTAILGEKINDYTKFIFTTSSSYDYVDVPYINYRGYVAYTEQGIQCTISKNPDTSMVRVYIPKEAKTYDANCTITVYYEGTKYQTISYFTSVISLVLFSLILVFNMNTKKNLDYYHIK